MLTQHSINVFQLFLFPNWVSWFLISSPLFLDFLLSFSFKLQLMILSLDCRAINISSSPNSYLIIEEEENINQNCDHCVHMSHATRSLVPPWTLAEYSLDVCLCSMKGEHLLGDLWPGSQVFRNRIPWSH